MNIVILAGNLGQNVELKYTQTQTAVANLSVATTEYRTGADNQRTEAVEWHKVVVWGKRAETCAQYLSKGSKVLIEGSIRTRSWQADDGTNRYSTEINAKNVQFMDSKNNNQGGRDNQGYQNNSNNNFPSNNQGGHSESSYQNQPSLDDIPF